MGIRKLRQVARGGGWGVRVGGSGEQIHFPLQVWGGRSENWVGTRQDQIHQFRLDFLNPQRKFMGTDSTTPYYKWLREAKKGASQASKCVSQRGS